MKHTEAPNKKDKQLMS